MDLVARLCAACLRHGRAAATLPRARRPRWSRDPSVIEAYLGGGGMSAQRAPRGRRPCCRLRAGGADRARRRASRVGAGEIVAILGPNGAGKSTLIKAVAGLVPKFAGSVRFAGRDVTALPAHRLIRHGLAFVPQTENIFAGMSVADNFALAAAILPQGERRARDRRDVRVLPGPRRAAPAGRRPALRRRAADAGGRARADGRAAAPHPRRGLGRAVAEDGGERSSPSSEHPRERRHHSAGRAERARGARRQRPRLCAGRRRQPARGDRRRRSATIR